MELARGHSTARAAWLGRPSSGQPRPTQGASERPKTRRHSKIWRTVGRAPGTAAAGPRTRVTGSLVLPAHDHVRSQVTTSAISAVDGRVSRHWGGGCHRYPSHVVECVKTLASNDATGRAQSRSHSRPSSTRTCRHPSRSAPQSLPQKYPRAGGRRWTVADGEPRNTRYSGHSGQWWTVVDGRMRDS